MRRPVHPRNEEAPAEQPAPIVNEEVRHLQRVTRAAQLMARGLPRSSVVQALQKEDPTCTTLQGNRVYREVMEQWGEDVRADLGHQRAAQLQRLQMDLVRMRQQVARPRKNPTDPVTYYPLPWAAIAKHEELIATITGTKAPVRVTVVDADEAVKDALTTVLGNLSGEDVNAILSEGEEVMIGELLNAAE